MRAVATALILLSMVLGQSLWQIRQTIAGKPLDEAGQSQASAIIVIILLLTVLFTIFGV